MEKLQKQLIAFLKGLTTAQIILLVIGTVVVGVTVWGFVWLIGNSDYKPLYTELDPSDAQKLTQNLAAQNIDYKLSADGSTVLVPSGELDNARLGRGIARPAGQRAHGLRAFRQAQLVRQRFLGEG